MRHTEGEWEAEIDPFIDPEALTAAGINPETVGKWRIICKLEKPRTIKIDNKPFDLDPRQEVMDDLSEIQAREICKAWNAYKKMIATMHAAREAKPVVGEDAIRADSHLRKLRKDWPK